MKSPARYFLCPFAIGIICFVFVRATSMGTFTLFFLGRHGIIAFIVAACAVAFAYFLRLSAYTALIRLCWCCVLCVCWPFRAIVFCEELANGTCVAVRMQFADGHRVLEVV